VREGGGQILRTALALAAATGQPFRIERIRAGRKPPGLKAQHLAGVQAVARLCNAYVAGAELGAMALTFEPGPITASRVEARIGTAGSIPLLLQAVLFPCLVAPHPVELHLEGGTDVRGGPPWDSITEVLLPCFRRLADIEVSVTCRGFYPPGGGQVRIRMHPSGYTKPLSLARRGEVTALHGRSMAGRALQEREVAERQAKAVRDLLRKVDVRVDYHDSPSPGSAVVLWAETDTGCRIGADCLGEPRRPAEEVGKRAARQLKARLDTGCAVDEHLTDQLVPLLAWCGGELHSEVLSEHTWANLYVVEQFLGKRIEVEESASRLTCTVGAARTFTKS
jgi:RNA 3'-phosphate cyclase